MIPKFDEKKATQIAGMLLTLRRQGGKMSYMKLIKLMYLIDREALMRWGWSMTWDEYTSMNHGQVLSKTYDLIREKTLGQFYWRRFISPPVGDKEVKLLKKPESGELSRAERALIEEIFNRYGDLDRWKLADITHSLPEYRKTEGPSLPVGYADVLLKAKKVSSEEVEIALKEFHALAVMQSLAT